MKGIRTESFARDEGTGLRRLTRFDCTVAWMIACVGPIMLFDGKD